MVVTELVCLLVNLLNLENFLSLLLPGKKSEGSGKIQLLLWSWSFTGKVSIICMDEVFNQC